MLIGSIFKDAWPDFAGDWLEFTDVADSVTGNVIRVGLPDFPLGSVKFSISSNVLTTFDSILDGLIPVPILTGTYYRPL